MKIERLGRPLRPVTDNFDIVLGLTDNELLALRGAASLLLAEAAASSEPMDARKADILGRFLGHENTVVSPAKARKPVGRLTRILHHQIPVPEPETTHLLKIEVAKADYFVECFERAGSSPDIRTASLGQYAAETLRTEVTILRFSQQLHQFRPEDLA